MASSYSTHAAQQDEPSCAIPALANAPAARGATFCVVNTAIDNLCTAIRSTHKAISSQHLT